MSATPSFVATPNCPAVAISTANTNRDGTGTLGQLFVAATNHSRIDRIIIKANGTTAAGMIRFFLKIGSSYYLKYEIIVSANTPSGTNPAWGYTIEFPRGLIMANGQELHVSTHNNETFYIFAEGGDF